MTIEPDARALLYGANAKPGLMGLAPRTDGIYLWWRHDGSVALEDVPFAPLFLISHPELLDSFKPAVNIEQLSGDNYYSYRVTSAHWEHQLAAIKHANQLYRVNRNDFPHEPLLRFSDEVSQYLLASGCTHYKELEPQDLDVLYIALRALNSEGADYADPTQASDRILMVGMSDGQDYQRVLLLEGDDEGALIEQVNAEINKLDPDVIAGHNLFKDSMHYLSQRARRVRVKLAGGRDGSAVQVRKSRAPAAEKQLEYPRADVAGRSLVDTWFLAQYYDIIKRDLERFDAPYVARYLDPTCQLPDPLPLWKVDSLWPRHATTLAADVHYELAAVRIIFQTLIGSYLAQAQMLPLSLQDCIVRGNGVKINNLLMREYLRRDESVPAPVDGRAFAGGYTSLNRTGLIRDVLNVDVASLYPSIMLSHGVKPASDTGDVFQPLLAELTAERLKAKQLARESDDTAVRVRADARQGAFKIFINSFFGYLGTNRMNWADPAQAEFITTRGQEIVQLLAQLVESEGGELIEIDTDGIYFTIPRHIVDAADEAQREELVARLNTGLPEGIIVELGGYFPAMLSHKVKNYALLDEHGEITVKGSGLKSRGLEPFLHGFIASSLAAILQGKQERILAHYAKLKRSIEQRTIDVRSLAKTDTLIDSLDVYREKVSTGSRNRGAAYEVALKAPRPLRPGDQVSYYIIGEKATVKAFEAAKPLRAFNPAEPDYNVKYYLKKLEQNVKKVQGYLPQLKSNGLFTDPSPHG
jgi:DNA polymerase I